MSGRDIERRGYVLTAGPRRIWPTETSPSPDYYSGSLMMQPRRSAIVQSVRRFVGAVLAVSGILLIANATVTLAWQEPISALLAARAQGSLEKELSLEVAAAYGEEELPAEALSPRVASDRTAGRVARRTRSERRPRVETGRAAGRIVLPTLGRDYVFVEGTDLASLRRGPGHLPDTSLPGEGGTVGFGGHRTTYGAPFRTIDRLATGDPIRVEMPYGRFTYRVRRTRIVRPDAVWVKRPVGREQIVLIACHPLYSAARRIVVFAKLERS